MRQATGWASPPAAAAAAGRRICSSRPRLPCRTPARSSPPPSLAPKAGRSPNGRCRVPGSGGEWRPRAADLNRRTLEVALRSAPRLRLTARSVCDSGIRVDGLDRCFLPSVIRTSRPAWAVDYKAQPNFDSFFFLFWWIDMGLSISIFKYRDKTNGHLRLCPYFEVQWWFYPHFFNFVILLLLFQIVTWVCPYSVKRV
jgi:hypothetical protein